MAGPDCRVIGRTPRSMQHLFNGWRKDHCMAIESTGTANDTPRSDRFVRLVLRLKWFVIPLLVALVCTVIAVFLDGLLGAILVAYSVLLVALSVIGLVCLSIIKAYERRE